MIGDNFCALRAILLAKAYLDLEKNLIKVFPDNTTLKHQAEIILKALKFKNKPMGINQIREIEIFLKYYSIAVLDGKNGIRNTYLDKGLQNKYYLYICLTNSHYNVIPNMATFYNCSYFCNYCRKKYSNNDHRCPGTCKCCQRQDCNEILNQSIHENLECKKCKRVAKKKVCLETHLFLVCDKREFCLTCELVKSKKHVCLNEKFCDLCKKKVKLDHKCYLKKDKTFWMYNKKFSGYIFYDYE